MTFVWLEKTLPWRGPRLKIEDIHSQVPIYITGPKGYVYVSKFLAPDFDILKQVSKMSILGQQIYVWSVLNTSMKTLDSI